MQIPTCRVIQCGAKMEAASEITGGSLRKLYGGTLRLSSEIRHEHHRSQPPRRSSPAPSAPTPGATTRRCSRPRARRSPRAASRRRSRRSRAARASGSARSTATSPTARRCSRRSTSTRSRRSAAPPRELDGGDPWEALNRLVRAPHGLSRDQAGARRTSCSTTSTATRALFQVCRASLYAAGEPLLKRAQEAGAVRSDVEFAEVMQMVDGDRQDPGQRPEPDRAHPPHRARRSPLPA